MDFPNFCSNKTLFDNKMEHKINNMINECENGEQEEGFANCNSCCGRFVQKVGGGGEIPFQMIWGYLQAQRLIHFRISILWAFLSQLGFSHFDYSRKKVRKMILIFKRLICCLLVSLLSDSTASIYPLFVILKVAFGVLQTYSLSFLMVAKTYPSHFSAVSIELGKANIIIVLFINVFYAFLRGYFLGNI